MSYGSLSLFYGGLESLLGPPQMHKDPDKPEEPPTLFKAMENDHNAHEDSRVAFSSSNGMSTTAVIEWEIVVNPKKKPEVPYPERVGMAEKHPEWCRKAIPIKDMAETMETVCNIKLRSEGHAEMIVEELIAGRLYTGPMYMKYNGVLRAKSKDPHLVDAAKKLTRGNGYATSIRASTVSLVALLALLTLLVVLWQ